MAQLVWSKTGDNKDDYGLKINISDDAKTKEEEKDPTQRHNRRIE